LAAVPEIPTAQPGVLHDVTSEVTPIVYGMWMRMLRSLQRKTHLLSKVVRSHAIIGNREVVYVAVALARLESRFGLKFLRFDALLAVLLAAEGGVLPSLVALNPTLEDTFDLVISSPPFALPAAM
jgi:hypothetical protein